MTRGMTGARILVVDDEPQILRFLKPSLTAAGYDVIAATTGKDALKAAATQSPDVILLDLIMPGKDGRETLADLRRNPTTRDIPVVICTGVELDAEETRGLLQHASAILSKRNLSRTSAPAIVRQARDAGRRLTTRTEGMA